MAAAFFEEMEATGSEVASSSFLKAAAALHRTGHEYRLPSLFLKYGFQADIKVTYENIGLKTLHPMLKLSDTAKCLAKEGKFEGTLLMGHDQQDLREFWNRFAEAEPEFAKDILEHHEHHTGNLIPLYLHTDEGATLKKKSILVLQAQCVLGYGSKRTGPGLNFSGNTFVTRLLFSVLLGRLYTKSKSVLYALLDVWSKDLSKLFHDGVHVFAFGKAQTFWFVCLGMKGDWPALVKSGRLTRHHLREAPASPNPPGICHLCRAGQNGFPWHSFGDSAAWLASMGVNNPLPWRQPSPLAKIPQGPDLASFYKVDLFHTCHKGVVADFVASTVAA